MAQSPPTTDLANYSALRTNVTIPDTQMAVSHSHILLATNTRLYFYNKQGDLVQGPVNTQNFFLDGDGEILNPLGMDRFFDGRTLFDPYRLRFWVASMARKDSDKLDPQKRHDKIVVAISKSEDPTYITNVQDSWYFYSWDAVADYKDSSQGSAWVPGDGIDYPSIGVDAFNFYTTIGVKTFVAPPDPIPANHDYYPLFRYRRLVAIDAKSAAGNLGLVIKYDSKDKIEYPNSNGNKVVCLEPVLHHGTSQRAYFVTWLDKNNAYIFAMYDPEKSNPTLDSGTPVKLTSPYETVYEPPSGPQSPTGSIPIDLKGGCIQNAVYRQGKLYFTSADSRKWGGSSIDSASIRLMRIPVSQYPNIPKDAKSGFINRIFGANNSAVNSKESGKLYYYGMPAVEVNKNGDIAIVYTRTSEETYPEIRYSAYLHDENDIRPSRLVRSGEATYQQYTIDPAKPPERFRWGDIAGISVDPDDDKTIWIAHQYASAEPRGVIANYRIWISKVFA